MQLFTKFSTLFKQLGNGPSSIYERISSMTSHYLPIIAGQNELGHQLIRNYHRTYFPRPKETYRIRRHGWKKRMSTAGGRRIIMNRILKGRYALTH